MDGKNPYEVPTEMREFAEKSVDQARKAFDGFIGAAQKAVDSAHGSAESARANVQDMTKKAMSYAENNIAAAFDLADKLVYLGAMAVSGAVLAGVVGWLLVRALARAGALSAFPAGQELREQRAV